MNTSKLKNKYEVENIIRKTLSEMFPENHKMPLQFNDTRSGIGHTFKYHRSAPYNGIWPTVLTKLHNLGLNEWQMSNSMDYSNPNRPVPAKWIGIRNARLNKRK